MPPLAAAALAVFYDGGYSGEARIAFAVAAIVAAGIALVAAPSRARAAVRQPLVLMLGALAVLGAASALWTLGPEGRTLRWAAVTAGYGAVFVAAAVAARAPRGRAVLAGGLAGIAVTSAALALGAVVLQERPYAVVVGGDWRAAGPFEYPPALALVVVSALSILLEGIRARALWLRAASGVGLAISAAALLTADSRTGLALALGVLAVFAFRATRRRSVLLAGAAVALTVGAIAFGPGDGPRSGFLHGREETWEAAAETFLDRPLHGAGADAFLSGSARHQEGAAIVFAHNLPLELAAEIGILGLLLAIALYAAVAALVWHSRANPAVWVFGAAALAFPLSNLLDWPWHLAGSGALWALACGALAGTGGWPANPAVITASNDHDQGDP